MKDLLKWGGIASALFAVVSLVSFISDSIVWKGELNRSVVKQARTIQRLELRTLNRDIITFRTRKPLNEVEQRYLESLTDLLEANRTALLEK